MQLDHLYIDTSTRRLISKACDGAASVYLAHMDKGLSGSSVWLAQWRLGTGTMTKLHVLKVGDVSKLRREHSAVLRVASVIEPNFPQMDIFVDSHTSRALLRQQFMGEPGGKVTSLREFVRLSGDSQSVRAIIQRLYRDRLKHWHAPGRIPNRTQYQRERATFGAAMDWWMSKLNLEQGAIQLGSAGLERSLRSEFAVTLSDISTKVAELLGSEADISVGPIHGDLHAQNVLIDNRRQLHLIDFAWATEKWRAMDFLMMECSLKFLVLPPQALLTDVLLLERELDEHWPDEAYQYELLTERMYGMDLTKVAAGISEVRRWALQLGAADSIDQYRKGLFLLTASLATIPSQINGPALFHSLARLCAAL